jgi:hypothetical protein
VDATLSNGATSYLLTGFVTNDGSGVEPTIVGNSLVITNNYEVFHLGNYRLGSASDPAEVTYESADGGLYEAITNFTDITLWQDGYGVNPGPSVPGDSIGDDPMILATLQSSSQTVPESSAAVVWSLLGALALGVGKWRKRGTTPDRSTNCQ